MRQKEEGETEADCSQCAEEGETEADCSQCAAASVLWCVAVCCGVLQCVAVCCSVLQCVAVCCSVLQCVAVCSGGGLRQPVIDCSPGQSRIHSALWTRMGKHT